VQRAFAETHAFQCGYCTPGMVLAARRLLEETPSPTEEDVRLGLAGNLCRCGSYVKIVEAVLLAAGKESEWTT
jgi:aerobic-type carbon monoxide dehydrogenase small subunit (CoxS/CutS family)